MRRVIFWGVVVFAALGFGLVMALRALVGSLGF